MKKEGSTTPWHDQLLAHLGVSVLPQGLEEDTLERLRQCGLYVDFSASEQRWQTPSEVVKEMAVRQYEDAIRSIARIRYYRERGLFEVPLLQKRATICRPVYDDDNEIPMEGERRIAFFVELVNLRKRFFDELVETGVLDRRIPC